MRMLSSDQIPQADRPDEILALARHVLEPKTYPRPQNCQTDRNLSYHLHALKMVGDYQDGEISERLRCLAGTEPVARAAFREGLQASPLGQAWVQWRADRAESVDWEEEQIDAFLEAVTTLNASMRKRRGQTLKRWLQWLKQAEPAVQQLDFLASLPLAEGALLPDPLRLPHNEGTHKVRTVLQSDLAAGDILLVTGYASVDELIRLLGQRARQPGGSVRILLGHEPFLRTRQRVQRRPLAEELRDFWLERGVSILLSADILLAQAYIRDYDVEIRIGSRERDLHAKIYLGPEAATLGSSNFTFNGLGGQAEANLRFEREEERYQEIETLAEHFWAAGQDYTGRFAELLGQLLSSVTWEEALARGCAEILEGEWAQKYLPAEEMELLEPALWPHQKQGISQALWTLINLGSVLIADAAGSGKTRMGAWLLRAVHDLQMRSGYDHRFQPVLIAPPSVTENWQDALWESRMHITPHSQGLLSRGDTKKNRPLQKAIAETSLLAVDEAHNFINNSQRTQSLLSHFADNVVLFTATPINRQASDLLGLVELLGADHFSNRARQVLLQLSKSKFTSNQSQLHEIKTEIQRFLVRRTRWDLNQFSEQSPAAYRMPNGRQARYPHHRARYYPLPLSERDAALAEQIVALCDRLSGIGRLGSELLLPSKLAKQGMREADYLQMVLSAAAALARYTILDCLRSSRAALYEHIHGTGAALAQLAPELQTEQKKATGNTLVVLHQRAGHPPLWKFRSLKAADFPAWVSEPAAHHAQSLADIEIYTQIAALACELSPERETAKVEHLAQLAQQRGQVIAFDSHVLTLQILEWGLRQAGIDCACYTGAQGAQGKARAVSQMGLHSQERKFVALCSDALSEGMNMQGASVVVHLDMPTVIRIAEQRAGRVDRMDSRHDSVEIWWPQEKGPFQLRQHDRLIQRHEVVRSLIGANLEIPLDEAAEKAPEELSLTEFAEQASLERPEVDLQGIFDAFRPVRALISADSLVHPQTYRAMQSSLARVVACVSVVKAEKAWGYFAVGGPDRMAPRWVLLEHQQIPLTSLDEVAAALTQRLSAETEPHDLDQQAERVMDLLLRQLGKHQQLLLPKRRQRALALAGELLQKWLEQAKREQDFQRVSLLQRLQKQLSPDPFDGSSADLRAVADAWLGLFRPLQQKILAERKGRQQLWQLDDLARDLLQEPFSSAALQKAFEALPEIIPLSDRIVAAIIGVPERPVGIKMALNSLG